MKFRKRRRFGIKIEEYNKDNMHTSKAREHCAIFSTTVINGFALLTNWPMIIGQRGFRRDMKTFLRYTCACLIVLGLHTCNNVVYLFTS